MARILIVEDEENLRFSIRRALAKAGHEASEADAVDSAWAATRQSEFDAVLTDISLSSSPAAQTGIDLVKKLREDGFEGPLVVMTAYGTVESAVAAMKLGADDYLQKPLVLEELVLLVDRLLDTHRMRRQLRLYQRMESARRADTGVLGQSPAWKATLELADRLARAPIPKPASAGATRLGSALPTILLLGDTGAGKGVLARYIHERGQDRGHDRGQDRTHDRTPNRAAGQNPESAPPFVHVNCSALPPSLVESELFGHEKGAFTDAKTHRTGLFEMAEGGTIFLDEIGDMPLDLQAKVLTVVEEGTYRRVGGSRDRLASTRVITATNQPLDQRVEEGKFRRDLLYRLNALTIRIPPLRDRGEDAVLIAEALLARFAKDYGRGPMKLTEDARRAIRLHTWPGNVREVVNMAQRVAMLADRPDVLAADLGLPPLMKATRLVDHQHAAPATPSTPHAAAALAASAPPAANHVRFASAMPAHAPAVALAPDDGAPLVFDFERGTHTAEAVERELIVQALNRTRGNVSKAAKLIGMQRSSFRYRIERYGLADLVQEIANR